MYSKSKGEAGCRAFLEYTVGRLTGYPKGGFGLPHA